MFKNYWLIAANRVCENEVLLVKASPETRNWYDRMPLILSIIYPSMKQPMSAADFAPKVGVAHNLRYTRFGIEAVLKMPKKYHRLDYYVLNNKVLQPTEPFWVILYK